jgi:steroid 5-alpha reductase family enzyme
VCLLFMWALCAAGLIYGQWTAEYWLLLGLGHLACAVVFYNFAYLFSFGYAWTMIAVHAVVIALRPSPAGILLGVLGILYGLRLWWFIHQRHQDANYGHIKARGDKASATMPMGPKVFLWISVSWLMAFAVFPAWHVAAAGALTPGVLAGAAIAAIGLVVESLGDAQKQAAKSRHPGQLVTSGLYAVARHPNYGGEMLFHLGLVVALLAAGGGWYALCTGLLTPVYIMVLMYYEARKQDHEQAERYASDGTYAGWRARTGLLLPGL